MTIPRQKNPPSVAPGESKISEPTRHRSMQHSIANSDLPVEFINYLPLADAAIAYGAHGWPVFPCNPKTKAPNISGGFKKATTDRDQIRKWWKSWPHASIGIAIPEGFAVLDIDPRSGGSVKNAQTILGTLPDTLTAFSGRNDGGRHIWFQVPKGIRLPGKLGEGLDLKIGGKGYVIAPPSVHNATGKAYFWEVLIHD